MAYRFSKRSIDTLSAVHPDLERVCMAAIETSPYDFGIDPNSIRNVEQQRNMVSRGVSQTMNSRHLPKLIAGWEQHGEVVCAIDTFVYVNGKLTWEVEYVEAVGRHIVSVAERLRVAVTYGGDWRSLRDYPHIELAWAEYPVSTA